MKEKTPQGEFFTCNHKSREVGKAMFFVASVMIGLGLLVGILRLRSY